VEKVQEAVVQALATQAPAAAAFAGMHEFERGNGFSMKERTAFGAITEGKTEDKEDTAGEPDNSLRRGPNQANQFTCTLSVMFMGVVRCLASQPSSHCCCLYQTSRVFDHLI